MNLEGCTVHNKNMSARGCIYGPGKGDDVRVALLGDSHAAQYAPPLIKIAEERSWKMLGLARSRCVIAQVRYKVRCDRWRRKAAKRIRNFKPDLVLISTATTPIFQVTTRRGRKLSRRASERFLRAGMAKTVRWFARLKSKRGTRTNVTVIRDQPLAPFRPEVCLQKKANQKNPSRCGFKGKRPKRRSFDFFGTRRVKRAQIIDPLPLLCSKRWCPAVDGDILIYRDRYHFTATWAETIAPWLSERIETQV